jgi:hypothetical protein
MVKIVDFNGISHSVEKLEFLLPNKLNNSKKD